MPVQFSDLMTSFPGHFKHHQGDLNCTFQSTSSEKNPKPNSLVIVPSKNHLPTVLDEKCAGVITTPEIADSSLFREKINPETVVLTTRDTYLAMALVLSQFFESRFQSGHNHGTHATATIDPSAQIHASATIAAGAVIHQDVVIEAGAIIRENVVIEKGSRIGSCTKIYPSVFIGRETQIGDNCVIQASSVIGSEGFGYAQSSKGAIHIPHQGTVVIGHHVEIGAAVTIDRGTIDNTEIGDHCILDNHIHIGHNCKFGRGCVLTGGFMIAGSSEVGDGFVAGARTGVLGHLKVASGVTVSADSVIWNDVTESGTYGGNPLLPIHQHKKRMVVKTQLVEMKRNISKLMKKVF